MREPPLELAFSCSEDLTVLSLGAAEQQRQPLGRPWLSLAPQLCLGSNLQRWCSSCPWLVSDTHDSAISYPIKRQCLRVLPIKMRQDRLYIALTASVTVGFWLGTSFLYYLTWGAHFIFSKDFHSVMHTVFHKLGRVSVDPRRQCHCLGTF